MLQLKKILVPTDFSEASHHALPHAVELARRFGAELLIAHIRTPFSGEASLPEQHFVDEGKYEEYVESELTEVSKRAGTDPPIETVAKRNISAASGILETISQKEADIVVMGTHGRSAMAQFFLGSVAEKVVRYSPIPVLTVAPDRPDYRKDPNYRKILATFDFSKHSKGAVEGAGQMAEKYEAQLQVLYVLEQALRPGYHQTWKESVTQDLPQIKADARRALAEIVGDDVQICVVVGTGDGKVHSEISRFAAEQKSDLVVMGTHGLSGFEHMLLGSTTERVVRSAPCPVLTFHLRD